MRAGLVLATVTALTCAAAIHDESVVGARQPQPGDGWFDAVGIRDLGFGIRKSQLTNPIESRSPNPETLLIRAARSRSNAAIAAHDPAGIARVWMEDVHVVSSTSAQTAGRAANQQRMAQQFARRPDTIYIRRPITIDVYAPWAVASERGEWTGRWTEPDGAFEIGGTYLVQWRKVGGEWLIQAELYVPTRCSGARYCAERP